MSEEEIKKMLEENEQLRAFKESVAKDYVEKSKYDELNTKYTDLQKAHNDMVEGGKPLPTNEPTDHPFVKLFKDL